MIPAHHLSYVKGLTGIDNLTEDMFSHFETVDVFNNNHVLEGYICKQSGKLYGSLLITSVTGKFGTEQTSEFVYCTPKFVYPISVKGHDLITDDDIAGHPSGNLRIYEKLDGTNILAYTYRYMRTTYLTYKTRLSPIVQNNSFSHLRDLWYQVLKIYPNLVDSIWELAPNAVSVGFEMYGNLNHILIEYDVPIDARALYTIRRTDGGLTPIDLLHQSVPALEALEIHRVTSAYHFYSTYDRIRRAAEARNDPGRHIYRAEGHMMYLHTADVGWQAFKAKPPSIEHIHKGIPLSAIQATVRNTFEDIEDPSYEDVKRLLLEEYPTAQIDAKKPTIMKVLDKFKGDMRFLARVTEAMTKENLYITEENKVEVLRAISKYFSKREMKKVHAVLMSKRRNHA